MDVWAPWQPSAVQEVVIGLMATQGYDLRQIYESLAARALMDLRLREQLELEPANEYAASSTVCSVTFALAATLKSSPVVGASATIMLS